MINAGLMRAIIAWIVVLSMSTSGLAFYWVARGGAVSYETAVPVVHRLLGMYGPLLGIWTGFYFAKTRNTIPKDIVSREIFYFTIFFLTISLVSPAIIILICDTIEAAMRILNLISGLLTTITSMCITYFFSKNLR